MKLIGIYQTPEYRPFVKKFETQPTEDRLEKFIGLIPEDKLNNDDGPMDPDQPLRKEDFRFLPYVGDDVSDTVQHFYWKNAGFRITIITM